MENKSLDLNQSHVSVQGPNKWLKDFKKKSGKIKAV
jgi:hypothetical protein